MVGNYTAIDDLVEEYNEMKHGVGGPSKEVMPVHSDEMVEDEVSPEEEPTQTTPATGFVQKRHDSISLPPDVKKIGARTPESDQADILHAIRFPISDERIMEDSKAPPTEAKRWYASILIYLLERAHITLKRIGDHVVRVMKFN